MTTDVHRLTVVEEDSQRRRLSRRARSVIAHVLLISASILMLYPLLWLLAAFRPTRDPQLTLLFNDLAWVTFSTQVGFLIAQSVILAQAIHLDRQQRPVFRPWVAHFNLAIAALLVPAAFAGTAMTGPLAWDGLLTFWVRNAAVGAWIVVMTVVLARVIRRQRAEAEAAVEATAR